MRFFKSLFAAGLVAGVAFGAAAAPMVNDGDQVAIIGDSITEQKMYTNFMECYILACSGLKNVSTMQFGWGGEQAGGYANRMALNYTLFPATVATTLYGMNDGGYRAFDANIGKNYAANSAKIAKFMKEKNVKFLAGSPGAVDLDTYRRSDPAVYNDTLNKLGELGEKAAAENGASFVNVHKTMMDAMTAAKKEYGKNYPVCGGDGFHPGPNGHLVMAYAFLKGLGFDGAIGTITFDCAASKAEATAGHKVLGIRGAEIEMESTRYPFVFSVGKTANQTSSILPFLPFNQDLNRFVLVVKNLPGEKAMIAFGETRKPFSKEALEKGINLAEEFMQETPFRAYFDKLSQVVRAKQDFETWLAKSYIQDFPRRLPTLKDDKKLASAFEVVDAAVKAQWKEHDKAVHAAVVPVRYTITVAPVK